MPVAKYQLPDGRVARFEVPDGTTPEQAQKIGDDFFAAQYQQAQPNQINLNEFNPGDFDTGGNFQAQPPQPGRLQQAGNLVAEAAAGFNRGVMSLPDVVPVAFNQAAALVGSDTRMPTLTENFGAQKGSFAGPGLATDIAAGAGEGASLGIAGAGLLKGAAAMMPGQSVGANVVRQIAASPMSMEAASGGGAGAGQVIGQDVGGDTGALIGTVAGGVAGAGSLQGLKSFGSDVANVISSKFARSPELIDRVTGLPVPAFEKALKARGLTFSSIADDVDNLPAIRAGQSPDDYANALVVSKYKRGNKNQEFATLRLADQSGPQRTAASIVPDDLGEELVKQGYRKGDIVAAKMASEATRNESQRMLRMKRSILSDSSKTQEYRPLDVAGEHALARVDFLRTEASKLRKQLNLIANGDSITDGTRLPGPGVKQGLRGIDIDTSGVESQLLNGLEDLNIGIPKEVLRDTTSLNNYLKGKDAFKGSDIYKNPSAQRMIKDVVDLLSASNSDAAMAHRVKRQLDQLIDYKKNTPGGLTDAGRNFAKDVRRSINDSIRIVSPQYAEVNDKLHTIFTALDSFGDVMPKKLNLFSENASKGIGQQMRLFEGNRQTRIPLEDATKLVDDAVRANGGSFDVNVRDLVTFNNMLEDRFGATARTSFQGQIEQAGNNVLRPTEAIKNFVGNKIGEAVMKKFGPDDEKALNALQKLLVRGK